jgi:cell growth-regulating nucleolar protein
MPWFYCDVCGDSIKKPKVAAHCNQCRHATFTCIDCSRPFDQTTVHGHTSCVTEHEKYAQGATKPGGFASGGFYGDGTTGQENGGGSGGGGGGAEGLEFLSTRAPWKCSICNVNCTSSETLMGHAAGAKHKRRAKAAIAARNGGGGIDKIEDQGKFVPAAAVNGQNGKSATSEDKKSSKDEKTKDKKKKKEVNWKKLAAKELKKSGGDMKSKKLIKALLSAAAGEEGHIDSDKILKKLEKSKKFKVDGKSISLVKA